MSKVKQDSWDFSGQELEAAEFTADEKLTVKGDLDGLEVSLHGQVESTLSNDTVGTTAEDGYLHFEKSDGTPIKVPYWIDD